MGEAAAALILGFLSGRAAELAMLASFGIAFFTARPEPLVGLAVAAGALIAGGPPALLAAVAGLAVCWLVRRWTLPPVAAGVGAALSRLVALERVPDPWSAGVAVLSGLVAAVLAVVFIRAVKALWAKAELRAIEDHVALALLWGTAVAGLVGWSLGPVALAPAAAALLALFAARQGVAAATIGGVALAVVAVVAAGANPSFLGVLAFAGLLAGLFAPWGRFLSAGAFMAGVSLVSLAQPQGPLPAGYLWGTVAGCALFALLPPHLGTVWGGPHREAQPLPERLRGLTAALESVAQSVLEAAPAAAAPPAALAPASPALATAVCPGCRQYARCWERNFLRAYKMVGDLLALAETRPVGPADVGGPETIECVRRGEMARAANLQVATEARLRTWRQRVVEDRRLLAGQMHSLAGVLGELAEDGTEPRPAFHSLNCETGLARLPRPEHTVSGDSHLIRELSGGRFCLALSDGMGVGPQAARQSLTATGLLEQLLEAGFTAAVAAQTINGVLLLRAEDESFATLDLVLVDLADGSAEFWKAGAAPSLLVHGGEVELIDAAAPPAGILPEAEPRVVRRVLAPGDQVVLVSDGVSDAGRRGEEWLPAWLAARREDKAQALASAILAEAVARAPSAHDDLTVLVCRLTSAGRPNGWMK